MDKNKNIGIIIVKGNKFMANKRWKPNYASEMKDNEKVMVLEQFVDILLDQVDSDRKIINKQIKVINKLTDEK